MAELTPAEILRLRNLCPDYGPRCSEADEDGPSTCVPDCPTQAFIHAELTGFRSAHSD